MGDEVGSLIKKAHKTIKNKDNWSQGCNVRDEQGHRLREINDPTAVKFCAYAALARVCGHEKNYHDIHHEALLVMYKALDKILGEPPKVKGKTVEPHSIVIYNDKHTHAEVLKLFEEAEKIAAKRA